MTRHDGVFGALGMLVASLVVIFVACFKHGDTEHFALAVALIYMLGALVFAVLAIAVSIKPTPPPTEVNITNAPVDWMNPPTRSGS